MYALLGKVSVGESSAITKVFQLFTGCEDQIDGRLSVPWQILRIRKSLIKLELEQLLTSGVSTDFT